MATIRPSKEITEQIKKFERFESKSYPDLKTGRMAIGYGDTEGDQSREITIEEATTRLHDRLARAGESIGKRLNREIPQDHQDVLLDMEYNGPFKSSNFRYSISLSEFSVTFAFNSSPPMV